MASSRWHQDREVAELIAHMDEPGRYDQWNKLTSSEMATVLKELDKCRKDFVYAARNYFWISNKDLGNQLFSLWPSQELILQKIEEMRAKGLAQKVIIIKSRQLGCSTLIEGLIAWRTMFFCNVNALVVSYDINHAAYTLYPIMQFIYDRMPWWLQPMIANRKAEEGLYFENPKAEMRRVAPGLNSRVHVKGATAGGVGQGIRLSATHISEFADFDDHVASNIIDEDMTNALVEGPGTFAILESTAKGANRFAHRLWRRCMDLEDKAEWLPLFLPFFFDPTHVRTVVSMPDGTSNFHADKQDIRMRDRAISEWVRCNNSACKQFHNRYVRGLDRAEQTCVTCSDGTLYPYRITDEQLHWIQHRRDNAKRDEKSMKKLLQEQACVVAGTFLSTDNGITTIDMAIDAKYCEHGRVTRWFNHGQRPVVRVLTKMGRELICTPDHRLFKTDGLEIAAEQSLNAIVSLSIPKLTTSEHTAVFDFVPGCQMSVLVTEAWGRILGYFMGDGHWSGTGIRFTVDEQDSDVADDISLLCERIIGKPSRISKSNQFKAIIVDSSGKDWARMLFGLGCLTSRGSDRKWIRRVNVPDAIWKSPPSVVRQFLSALIDCDGHAYKETPLTKYPAFAQHVQLLLLAFGINAQIKTEDKTHPDGHAYIGRSVQMKAAASNLFHEAIGFASKRKRDSACVRPALRSFAFKNELEDTVVQVSDAGMADVFDIEVAGTHRFGANGILVHNSSAEEAFQVTGYQVFGQKAQDFANACVRNPIAIGDFDLHGRLHGCNPKGQLVEGAHGTYRHCFQEECSVDHSYDDNPLEVWEMPKPGCTYCIGGDVAEGLGGKADFSAGVVIRYTDIGDSNYQVATWKSNTIDPIAFAAKLYWLGIWFNDAQMAVECNKYDTCLSQLRFTLNYPNMYRWKHVDSLNPLSNKLGWWTDCKSRPRLYQTFRAWLNQEVFQIRSRCVAEQMKSFVKDDFDDAYAGADRDEHDDELMACQIALFCAVEGSFNEALGLAIPRSELNASNAAFIVECLSCRHTWPEIRVTVQEGYHDMAPATLDATKSVTAAGGTKCPACFSRHISITRNSETQKPPPTDVDMAFYDARLWTPEMEFENATRPYELL